MSVRTLWIIIILFCLAFYGTVGAVAYHFAARYW